MKLVYRGTTPILNDAYEHSELSLVQIKYVTSFSFRKLFTSSSVVSKSQTSTTYIHALRAAPISFLDGSADPAPMTTCWRLWTDLLAVGSASPVVLGLNNWVMLAFDGRPSIRTIARLLVFRRLPYGKQDISSSCHISFDFPFSSDKSSTTPGTITDSDRWFFFRVFKSYWTLRPKRKTFYLLGLSAPVSHIPKHFTDLCFKILRWEQRFDLFLDDLLYVRGLWR